MKVRNLTIKRFKKFEDETFSFLDEETGATKDLVVIVGPDGSGKSTILQALAAVLGRATGRIKSPAALGWPGFDLSLAQARWETPSVAEVEVELGHEEIEETRRLFELVPTGEQETGGRLAEGRDEMGGPQRRATRRPEFRCLPSGR